ncbi:MAG: hypothetical protein IPI60_00130 [Saprospiraceae bacterium]|nr:hypothetical protein [Saprospiraceae bacterium]
MTIKIKSLSIYFEKHPGRIFAADGLGALLSALCLGIILPIFEDAFGMPLQILYLLAFIAIILAAYSFFCYTFITRDKRHFLKLIILANVLYCILTVVMVIYFFQKLTKWDLTYFILESLVILFLIRLEYWVLTRFVN